MKSVLQVISQRAVESITESQGEPEQGPAAEISFLRAKNGPSIRVQRQLRECSLSAHNSVRLAPIPQFLEGLASGN